MEIDYEKLNDILRFLRDSGGYQGWNDYRTHVMNRDNLIMDTINNSDVFAVWGNILLNWNLVDYKYDGNKSHTYIINPNGLDLVNNNLSTRTVHEDHKKRLKLEDRILEGTIESHYIGKASTQLNRYQLIVTIILGAVSVLTILFQYQANKIANKSLEISEKVYQLELENKTNIDTIFVKMKSNKTL